MFLKIKKNQINSYLDQKFKVYRKWWGWKYHRYIHAVFGFLAVVVVVALVSNTLKQAYATNLVPVTGYANVDDTGNYIYFNSDGANVEISNWNHQLSGYAWSTDLGWIDFGNDTNNPSGPVTVNSSGQLSGEAEVLNDSSYVNFSSTYADAQVNSSGVFSGYAWSTDLGWINFSGVTASGYSPDFTPPPTNASNIQMYFTNGGQQVSSAGWVNTDPYFTWTAGADDVGGSGLQGYCLYLGQDPTGNPVTTKGDLGTSPVNTNGSCQFTISTNNIDTSITNYLGTALTTSNSPYYLNIKAIDNADNIYNGSSAQFEFYFDNTPAN